MKFRIEKDFLGEKKIPMNVYWGIHTKRATENFAITEYKINKNLIKALAIVKKACCMANNELGYLKKKKSIAILSACDEIIEEKWLDQFPLDPLQGGAGTSLNMNINEVIANRAIEILKGRRDDYQLIHPIEDVNLHQSTNDVFPTAIKIAAIYQLRDLSQAVARLQGIFQKKEKEFANIVKMGRTELQEAVPITMGVEFSAFAEAIARDRWRTFKCEERLRIVNIGGTAVGTGLTAPRSYIFLVIEKLREITGLGLARGENVVEQTANSDAFVEVSGILKAHASNLIKISSDLRILNLTGEIQLPQLQAGSSIMPGKINPVIAEAAIQAGLKVIANDSLITECTSRSTLQINEFLPLLSFSFLESLDILLRINDTLANYIKHIKASHEKCSSYVNQSPSLITAFLPVIGYDKANQLLKEFFSTGKNNLKEFLTQKLGKKIVDKILSPYHLTALGYKDNKKST